MTNKKHTSASLYSGVGSTYEVGNLDGDGSVDPSGPSFYPDGTVDLRGERGPKGDDGEQGPEGPRDELVLTRLDELSAGIAGAWASIIEESTLRLSADEAEAVHRTELETSLRTELSEANSRITDESLTRSTSVDALASRLTTIEADYTTAYDLSGVATSIATAKVAEEATARANADGALAGRLTTIEANYATTGHVAATVSAAVTEEQTARASAEGALASRLSTIEADYVTAADAEDTATTVATAKVAEEATARANAVSAEATQRQTLATTLRGETTAAVAGEAAARNTAISAAVSAEATARSNADGALSGRISTIEADYTTSGAVTATVNAKVAEEATARTTAVAAEAARIGVVEAQMRREVPSDMNNAVNFINGRVATEETVRANADGALSGRISTIEAGYQTAGQVQTTVNAKVAEEATARSNADGALSGRITTIESSYQTAGQVQTAVNAKVAEEATARTNAVGALAGRVDTVEATAGSASSNASVALTAAQDAQTKLGQARVRLLADAGNGRAQLELYSDSYGSAGVDITGNVRINGTLLVTQSVNTGQITNGALSNSAAVKNNSNVTLAGNSTGTVLVATSPSATVVEVTLTSNGTGQFQILFNSVLMYSLFFVTGSRASNNGLQVNLSRIQGRVTTAVETVFLYPTGVDQIVNTMTVVGLDAPPAGTVTYRVDASSSGSGQQWSNWAWSFEKPKISVLELKK